jgi:tRNA-dihydrouridine synthase B
MIQIGPYNLASRVVLAPMAGVTDQPFRKLCKRYGAGITPGEMLTCNTDLWNSDKNRFRRQHDGEESPRVVQIAGSDPQMLADAARLNVDHGAQIIDINMGCPAKKVLKKAAGSALLKDELLVRDILKAVVNAVEVPVTLKIRTGWCPESRNGVVIARIAEDHGIASLAVHGRTRACMFKAGVEYDTIATIKENVSIPVFANGDITTPEKAAEVLKHTRADGIMIGRGAQGRPWLFAEIDHFLQHGTRLPVWETSRIGEVMLEHVGSLHRFYGEFRGVMIARKHTGWYLETIASLSSLTAVPVSELRKAFNPLSTAIEQIDMIRQWFSFTSTQRSIAA